MLHFFELITSNKGTERLRKQHYAGLKKADSLFLKYLYPDKAPAIDTNR